MYNLRNRDVALVGHVFLVGLVVLSGCSQRPVRLTQLCGLSQTGSKRSEGHAAGRVGPLLEGVEDEKLRYVVYRSLEAQRERLRSGRDRWTELDIVSLVETTKRDMNAEYQPLRAVAKGHYLWAKLEGMEPGQLP